MRRWCYIHPDFPAAVKEMTRVKDTFEPQAMIHARYNDLYHGVYKRMYDQLQPLYRTLGRKV
jgi:sugar (pentulose or hexulose) kinase